LDIEAFKGASKLPVVIVLDNVRSLNNIGSVFRTSDAFRIESVILCGITATPPHKDIHKTALGATESVNWSYSEKTVDAILDLKSRGFTILAIEQVDGSIMLESLNVDLNGKYALVLGHEMRGVQQEVIDQADFCVEIPQYGTKHSLNISVATGIVVWEMFKQLNKSL
jgi:23S rRNA (guanosine2251-2'-O)-methyltransferase